MSALERYLRRGADARAREIVTPEGVALPFVLASRGERLAAFVLDTLFMVVALVIVVLVAELAGGGPWIRALAIVAAFVIRHFYFVVFETRWQGTTPGKRIVGTRVIDARGGPLDAGAILARNLVREIEVWAPLAFLIAGDELWPGAPGWATLAATVWLFVFALMPLFNRDRLRVGDLIGGTRVVVQPRPLLLPDLADAAAPVMIAPGWAAVPLGAAAPVFTFTREQLDVYGIYELQVLEGVLRANAEAEAHAAAMAAVAGRIHAKLRYGVAVGPHQVERFLRDFYTALRAHLEQRMLFGERRADKHAR